MIRPPSRTRWTRLDVARWICNQLDARNRFLIGLDFAFGFPFENEAVGYLGGLAGHVDDIFALWELIERKSCPEPDFGCSVFTRDPTYSSLFWKTGPLPAAWSARKRRTELVCAATTQTRPETVYKLLGSKQVGKASITGIRVLHHIRSLKKERVAFWPFQKIRGSAMVEIYPTLFRKSANGSLAKLRTLNELNGALKKLGSRRVSRASTSLSDHETDALISAAGLRFLACKRETWLHPELESPRVQREGWIFGVGA